eukprot:TRINITY_DN146_c0_g1_i1.p3 TRINITY_DN146_c0_g1~~TRINITY_DN146_c0_g1_i1.p3  ORF type:complete len:149 (-),score=30.96 TRINITY_DN146_c0_g1_i1:153-599(-)
MHARGVADSRAREGRARTAARRWRVHVHNGVNGREAARTQQRALRAALTRAALVVGDAMRVQRRAAARRQLRELVDGGGLRAEHARRAGGAHCADGGAPAAAAARGASHRFKRHAQSVLHWRHGAVSTIKASAGARAQSCRPSALATR